MTFSLPDRFWAKVRKTDACWEWTACRGSEGYGQIRWQKRKYLAHRLAYEALVGPIPDGLHLDHLCRNRACVNPAHLEPVTCRTNILRGVGLAAQNAKKDRCPQGHAYSPRPGGGRWCMTCKAEHLRRYERRRGVREQIRFQLQRLQERPGEWVEFARYPLAQRETAHTYGYRVCRRHPGFEYRSRTVGDEVVVWFRAPEQQEAVA